MLGHGNKGRIESFYFYGKCSEKNITHFKKVSTYFDWLTIPMLIFLTS